MHVSHVHSTRGPAEHGRQSFNYVVSLASLAVGILLVPARYVFLGLVIGERARETQQLITNNS